MSGEFKLGDIFVCVKLGYLNVMVDHSLAFVNFYCLFVQVDLMLNRSELGEHFYTSQVRNVSRGYPTVSVERSNRMFDHVLYIM